MKKLRMFCSNSICFAGLLLSMVGCASYTTPGGPAQLAALTEPQFAQTLSATPSLQGVARVAIAHVQDSGYRNLRQQGYGQGTFSLVLEREVESESDLRQIQTLPGIAAVAPINRLLLPPSLDSMAALRHASARLQCQLLLVYTFDSHYHTGQQQLPFLNTILLGALNNQPLTVRTTVSAALFDVKTDYVYYVAEASSESAGSSSIWQTDSEVDKLRQQTEREAFSKLVRQFSQDWPSVHAPFANASSAPVPVNQ